ncbi:phage integrase SAM-like domain-containing protein [Larkinella soli]|uniref:phage integrase SAM-like domain-containing protein n=1 Tax=Larkinella soli TaxID=1770527 RepID=UPI0013E325AD|nr:phage integrase SAM-like domain-containing protein [Larkinella soli]
MEVSFWRHKSKRKGYAQLYCRISVLGDRQDIGSTGITIRFDDWDPVAEKILPSDPMAYFKNEQLLILRNQLAAIYNELYRSREPITAGKIKRQYLGGPARVSLPTAFEMYLKALREDPGISPGTIEAYNDCRKKLLDYLIHKKALDLPVQDFDVKWLDGFRTWMKRLILPSGKLGHEDSYVRKHSITIKQVTRWAKLQGLADFNSLDGFKVPGVKDKKPIFLTLEQFERLRSHRFKNPTMQEVADIFILYCRTGFHYGDLIDFVKQYKQTLQRGIDGRPWLIKERIKTEVEARVPQFAEVAEIVEKYGGWEKLPVKANKTMNDWLKLIAAELDLPPGLSTKAGRKTFTDWCFNSLGLSKEAVMVMLGRKSDKGLDVYGRPDERRVIQELSRASKRKGVKLSRKAS